MAFLVFGQAAQPLVGFQVAQLRGQRRQCHFAQAALVVAGNEGHQQPPVVVQRRAPDQEGGDGAHLLGVYAGRRLFAARPHNAQHLACAQGHPNECAWRGVLWGLVAQRIPQ